MSAFHARVVFPQAAAMALLALPTSVIAHHAMGGAIPTNGLNGFASGLAHPVIGIDHLAFIIGIGLLCAFSRRAWLSASAFVAATLLGTVSIVNAIALPAYEFLVAISVLAVACLVIFAKPVSDTWLAVIAVGAGLFHGYAYGAAIVGAETSPLLAYLLGFAVIQTVLILALAMWVRRAVAARQPSASNDGGAEYRQFAPVRIAGGVIAGVAVVFLSEYVEALI